MLCERGNYAERQTMPMGFQFPMFDNALRAIGSA
jgi:hypothetical protein